ncbi:MAG: hypothetical protein GY839_14355 [candidate division Zixibacteria bacterium]|nr:hypothetical protein [candidate division Zixibacteria bacterium]
MQNVIRNMYKVKGLFVCKHPVHERFDFKISPFHVLRQKKCFGEGCVEFKWLCNIGNKGKKCPKGYKHVGRNCFSCKYYDEEKICRMPSALVDETELKTFMRDLDEYEYWLSTVEGKRVKFSGEVSSVYPALLRTIDDSKSNTRLNGFLIKFEAGHIDNDIFDDTLYLQMGSNFLSKWQPAPGDEIDCESEIKNDRGRIVLYKPTQVDITRNGAMPLIDCSKALVGKTTGAIVTDDIRLCRDCPYGALMDIHELPPKENRFRRFYCLRGIEIAYTCPIRLEKILNSLRDDPVGA